MRTQFAIFVGASLDGFIARGDGSLDWLKPFEGEDHGYAAFLDSVDALVIGRSTWDTVLSFPEWPYADKRVIVCTRRPAQPVHGEQLWAGSPRELAEKLGAEGTQRVYLDGGALISSFLRDGLVDELTVSVVPIILGGGRPLFDGALPQLSLSLIGAKSFPSGLVQLRYRRA